MGVLSLVQSAETGQRGYLLTNSQAYLIPYDRGTAAVGPAIDELGKLVIDNPQQTPHNGHSAMPPSDRTAKIIESDESFTLSITNPLGTSDEIRIPARMALIPPLENRKLGRKIIRCESDPLLRADRFAVPISLECGFCHESIAT